MTKISREEVLHIAKLARLDLSEQEVETYSEQLSDILWYVKQLQKVDTNGVQPLTHVYDQVNHLRSDTNRKSLNVKSAVQNAPDTDGTYFKVPQVIKD